jgi:hypothetical protein
MLVTKIDVTKCVSCGGEVRVAPAITDPLAVRRSYHRRNQWRENLKKCRSRGPVAEY